MTEEPKDPKAAGDKPAMRRCESAQGVRRSPAAGSAPALQRAAQAPCAACREASPAPNQPQRPEAGARRRRLRTTPSPRRPPARPIRPRRPAPRFRRLSPRCRRPCPDGVEQVSFYVGDWTVIVPATKLLEVGRFLRDTPEAAFDFCSDVTASDWPTRPQRFDVVYCLFSTRHRKRVRLKVRGRGIGARAVGQRHLAGCQLARARGVRPVRRELHRPSRIANAF